MLISTRHQMIQTQMSILMISKATTFSRLLHLRQQEYCTNTFHRSPTRNLDIATSFLERELI
jgi:hypothetical protein